MERITLTSEPHRLSGIHDGDDDRNVGGTDRTADDEDFSGQPKPVVAFDERDERDHDWRAECAELEARERDRELDGEIVERQVTVPIIDRQVTAGWEQPTIEIIDRQVTAGWEQPTTIEIGASAEQRAVYHLELHGYRIVERNFKTKLGELDIVARDRDGVLCFIEVRSRTNHEFGNAAESVNQLKRGKVTRMAQIYLGQRRPRFDEARFDVVALTGDHIDLIRDAWRLGDRT